jgi:hypothetical protein
MRTTHKRLYYTAGMMLAACLVHNASAAPSYTWSGLGDGTTWSDGANWTGGVAPTLDTFQITIDPVTSVLPVTIGASTAAVASDNVFGPEWGQTLDIYGSLASGLFFTPVGSVGGPTSTINLYGSGSLSAADTIFIGDPF